jgi:glyceraldehyde-3-phosphate dehydrogenase (NADP+)
LVVTEAGKPLLFARTEVGRAADTFRYAAETLRSHTGELLNLDLRPGLEQRLGLVRRFPAGPTLCIAPFNFPLNLVAHKLAPCVMAGNSIVLKPASTTPLASLALGQLLLQAGWPPAALSVVPAPGRLMDPLVQDARYRAVSFTGSGEVGWRIKELAGRKKVILELGGDAAAIVLADAHLPTAAQACAIGAFGYAGQVCISVQRIIVEDAVYDEFSSLFRAATQALPVGNPALPETVVGPMIAPQEAQRTLAWLTDAQTQGASVWGGSYHEPNNLVQPAVVEHLPATALLHGREAFAPIAELIRVPSPAAAFARANASPFGLQAGVFTASQARLKEAFFALEVGGVVANDVPTFRLDNMPYGGVKASGFGREGVRYAYEELTEPRLLVW